MRSKLEMSWQDLSASAETSNGSHSGRRPPTVGDEMSYDWRTEIPGVFARHADSCPVREGGRCTCGPLGYRSSIRDWENGKRMLSPQFDTLSEAHAWQRDQTQALDAAQRADVSGVDLGEVIDDFLHAVDRGRLRDRNGESLLTDDVPRLRRALRFVDSELGAMKIQEVRRRHVQALVDELDAAGLPPGRVVATIDALADLYSFAIQRDLVDFNPLVELELPQQGRRRPAPDDELRRYPDRRRDENTTSWLQASHAPLGAPRPQRDYDDYDRYDRRDGYDRYDRYDEPVPDASATARLRAGLTSGAMPAVTDNANYDATMQERFLWWTVRIIVIVFVLIALVLAAESI